MWLKLYSTHIDTICELHEIAARHNCKIAIHVEDHHSVSDDYGAVDDIMRFLVDNDYVKQEVLDSITDEYDFDNGVYLHDDVCFELIEPIYKNEEIDHYKYNQMIYHVYSAEMHYEKRDSWWNDKRMTQEAENWTDENFDGKDGVFYRDTTDVVINGFEGVTTKINVYREGMAVKNFGDLVCDYLGEPRIIKNY